MASAAKLVHRCGRGAAGILNVNASEIPVAGSCRPDVGNAGPVASFALHTEF